MLAVLFVIVAMALLAIPGSANFVGEFFILKGVFETKVAIALIASIGIALAAFYSLRMYQRTMHNREAAPRRLARDRAPRGGRRRAARRSASSASPSTPA